MTVIAMTREIGSHGLDISSAIARELGLRVINSEIVASRVASNLGVKESAVQRYLQGAASLLERWQIDKRELSRLTAEEIFGLAQQGDVLIRGWGVSALFRDVPQCPQRAYLRYYGSTRTSFDGTARNDGPGNCPRRNRTLRFDAQ